MMTDIVFDTNVLAELLVQYYGDNVRDKGCFESKGFLNKDLVREMNRTVRRHAENDGSSYPGLLMASSFAFVEIARKFDEIAGGRFTTEQFAAFIEQPPEWFFIADVDASLFPHLNRLPREISLPNGNIKPLEWADAIHAATALSRDDPWLLAATDPSIKQVAVLKDRII